MSIVRWAGIVGGLAALHCANAARGVDFVFLPSANTPPAVVEAITAAGARWSANLSGDFTLTINIDFAPQSIGTLALTSPVQRRVDYSVFCSSLTTAAKSPDDLAAVGHLTAGTSFQRLINLTADNPAGRGSLVPYQASPASTGNRTLVATQANLRAVGLRYSGSDASITFNSNYDWSFDPRSVGPSSYDLVGMATHELGHVLGFSSGVDGLDAAAKSSSPPAESQLANVSPMDLFRYSAASTAAGSIDWTADARDKYFSIDGGQTALANFSTGANFGDGRQASHWKRGASLGVMGTGTAAGQQLAISQVDRRMMDVLGYTLNNTWQWNGQSAGNWNDPADWNTFSIPHAAVDAVFDVPQPTTVALSPSAKANSLAVRAGAVTVNTSGGDLSMTGNLTIAAGLPDRPAALTFAGGNPVTIGGSVANSGSFTHSAAMLSIAGDFDNLAGSAVFNGPQTWGGASALRVSGGRVTLNTNAGGIGAAPALVRINSNASLQINASQYLKKLDIAGSAAVGDGAGMVLSLGDLTIESTGQLDLNSADLIIRADPAGRHAALASVNSLLATGRANGTWTGRGIASHAAASDRGGLTGLAAILNDRGDGQPLLTTFAGQAVDANSILVRYTLNGDSDLNGIINADDYFQIDAGRMSGLGGYRGGDLDYDGRVTAADYTLIDRAYLSQTQRFTELSAGRVAVAAPMIPEPAVLAPVAFAGLLLRRRRRPPQ